MTYKDINTKLSQLEVRDEQMSRDIEKACSKIDSITNNFSLMSATIDRFEQRHRACISPSNK